MLSEGAVVVVDIAGEWVAGVVRSVLDRGRSAMVLTRRGTQRLRIERIVRVTCRRVPRTYSDREALSDAEATLERLLTLRDEIDLETLWELALEEGKRAWTLGELAELALPERPGEGADALALALATDHAWFRVRKEGLVPNPRHTVEAIRAQREAARRREQALDEAAAALRAALDGGEAPGERPPEGALGRAVEWLRDYAVHGGESQHADVAAALIERAGAGAPTAERAFDLLVGIGSFGPDENLELLRHDISEAFPAAVLREVEEWTAGGAQALADAALAAGAADLRHLEVVAVDDEETRDADDAFVARRTPEGGWEVTVVIADVAAVVPLESATAAEARRRAASLYLPDRIVPMLPPALSEGALSLMPGADRLVMAFHMRFAPSGVVEELRIERGVARVAARVPYEQAERILQGERDAPDSIRETLEAMASLAPVRRSLRLEAGAIPLRQVEVKVRVQADGTVVLRRIDPWTPARMGIAELMIATCEATARWCSQHCVPTVYRWQAAPGDEVDAADLDLSDPVVIAELLRHMRRAELSSYPRPHFALGVEAYTQVTSPLRRYQDFAMQHQIAGVLAGGEAPMDAQQVLHVFAEVDRSGSAYGRVERATRRYWVLRWLEQQGTPFETEAIVLRDVGSRYQVSMPELGLTHTMSLRRRAEPGDRVRVAVVEANARRGRLVVEPR